MSDPTFRRLVRELRRIDAERLSQRGLGPSRPRPRGGDRRSRSRIARRRIAAIVAIFVTGLAALSLVLGRFAPVSLFDVPLFAAIRNLGRSFLPDALLPLVPLWAAVSAWGIWLFYAATPRRRAARKPLRSETAASEGKATPSASSVRRRSVDRVLRELRPYGLSLTVLFLVSMAAAPLALVPPLALQLIVDEIDNSPPLPWYVAWLTPNPSGVSTQTVVVIAIGMLLGATFLTHLQGLAKSWLANRLGNRMDVNMRVRLFRQLQRLSTAYHDTQGTTDSTYRIQYDATALRALSTDGLISLVTDILTLAGMIGVIATFDWQLSLIALSVTPFLFLFTLTYKRRLRLRWRTVKRSESEAMSAAQESLSASRVVKAFGQEDRANEQFRRRYTKSAMAALKVIVDEGVYQVIIGVVTAIALAAVLFVGAQHVQAGTLQSGQLVAIFLYMAQLYTPLKDVGKKVLDIQKSMAGMERFLEILDEKADVPEKLDARPLKRAIGQIAFQNVSFGYDPARLVLRGMSFELAPGTSLGVVGPTGSGKTTLANLLVRFFDVTEGSIALDGVDLRDYKVADLRNQFAVVLQDTLLFSTTIIENIRFARSDATDGEVVAAARLANAHGFIEALPDGYDTQVGERGMKLSGGERQRISLARAFLKDAPILILDEPTSSLDLATEASVIDSIHRLMKGRTTLMIAHRPSTLRACDAILILEPNGTSRMTEEVVPTLQRLAANGAGGLGGGSIEEGAG